MSLRHATRAANALRTADYLIPSIYAASSSDFRGLAVAAGLKRTTLYDFHVLHGGAASYASMLHQTPDRTRFVLSSSNT
jgi:hypothetical protein